MSADGDLAAFLAARLGEDETAARAATPGPWVTVVRTFNDDGVITDESYPPGNGFVTSVPVMAEDETRSWANQEHIARHDPAVVLADVAAKRAILTEWLTVRKLADLTGVKPDGYRYWVLRQLASAYSSHPDYKQEWKP